MTMPTQYNSYVNWITAVTNNHSQLNIRLLESACSLSDDIAKNTVTPYASSTLTQGIQIADILLELDCDSHTIAAAILYPSFYYGNTDKDAIINATNSTVYKLLNGTQNMEATYNLRGENQENTQLTNLRKMFLAIVDDIRVVLIKLAEQLSVLINLKQALPTQQVYVAQQVMDIYAPLANRLGIGQLKWQLEDYAFRYLQPDTYKTLSKALKMRRTEREHFIQSMIEKLTQLFNDNKLLNIEMAGRAKHIYSIHKKIQRKHTTFDDIYDTSALRVLVDTVEDCYAVLSIVHANWSHITKEFDDYISHPKENGYQSIHTAIICDNNTNVEIQIRTRQMHEDAELGVAAHWKYKEENAAQGTYEEKIAWLREVMSWQQEVSHNENDAITDIFNDRIYVFTPAGDVYDLIAEATPLDFAFHIHTSVGLRCKGAKINDKMAPLTHSLKTGDRVEIITSKGENPSRDWLDTNKGYLKTSQAKSKVRHWFKKQNFERDFAVGEELWNKACKRENLKKSDCGKVSGHFNFKTAQQLIAAIGSGNLSTATVIQQIKALNITRTETEIDESIDPKLLATTKKTQSQSHDHIIIDGIDSCLTQLAKCCLPIPGDNIIGYITQGNGITIHQYNCNNIQHSMITHPHRIIDVNWDQNSQQKYTVELILSAQDRSGLIRDITSEIMQQKISLIGLSTRKDKLQNIAYLDLAIEITSDHSLHKIQNALLAIPGVLQVTR